jgi:hypothetical protein
MLDSELELEAELESLMTTLTEGELEAEAGSGAGRVALQIPDAPYSDDTFKLIHKSIDVFEAVHAGIAIFGPELLEILGAVGMGIEVLGPLAGFAGSMFALGAGYAEGRSILSRRRVRDGFAFGFVMGAHGRKWPTVKSMWWEYQPEINTFDQDAGKVAQKAFNLGLSTGYLQGRDLAQLPNKKKFFWASLNATLSPGERAQFFNGNYKSWSELQWRDYYTRMMAAFIRQYVKD